MALAVAALLLNEWAYQRSMDTALEAAQNSNARGSLNRVMVKAGALDADHRGYVRSGDPVFKLDFDMTLTRSEDLLQQLGPRYATVGGDVMTQFDQLQTALRSAAAFMQANMNRRDAGALKEASSVLDEPGATSNITQVVALGQELVTFEDNQLATHRVKLYSTLNQGRIGIIVLIAAGLVATGLLRWQSHALARYQRGERERLTEENRRLEQAVASRTQALQSLTRHQQTLLEDERAALARELHDELGALLTAAKLDIARLKSKITVTPDVAERLGHLNATLNEGISLKRRIIEDLRPSALDSLGLVPALQILCEGTASRLGIPVQATLAPVDVSKEGELTLYRFVQEALTNAAKYAQAHAVTVTLHPEGSQAHIKVADDGVGFDAALVGVGHHGLSGMRFRVESHGGTMAIESGPNGSTLSASLPTEA